MGKESKLRVALPKGRLLGETASLVERAGWGFDDYEEGTRSYRLQSRMIPNLSGKIFQERDIPIQVAVGNYDLGICGLDWVEELLSKYPSSELVKLRDLGYGAGIVYAAQFVARAVMDRMTETGLDAFAAQGKCVRLASEYPNLAESFAMRLRLKRFSVFPLWGAAEVYPPENADVVLVSRQPGQSLNHDLATVAKVLDFSACLIANRRSLESKDLSPALASLGETQSHITAHSYTAASLEQPTPVVSESASWEAGTGIRLALPDGHQQQPTIELLKKAGIRVDDYPSSTGNRRPVSNLEGVAIKVIRPQDMPLQVANGNFDLAITGKDWLTDHLSQFPGSPVTELLDLRFGWVRIVAVVCEDVPASSAAELRRLYTQSRHVGIRIATEYTNIADKYARDNHLGLYRVIPTWGATEAFLPEDADLLIENTQTGRTLAQHNLKIIDTLFESTARLIGNRDGIADSRKRAGVQRIIDMLRKAVE